MTERLGSLEALEERHSVFLSLALNLPGYLMLYAAAALFTTDFRTFDSFGAILGWAIVLAPFLTGGAVAHAIWAGRAKRVGRTSLLVVRATTALGVVAVAVSVFLFLMRFAV